MTTEKLQKVLARSGLGSRRELETWISEGRISVNGQTATLGCRVSLDDKIYVNGKQIKLSPLDRIRRRVIMYHKPEGEICTRNDPENRTTVFAGLPVLRNGRWVVVGRLDINSSGLLLFTNDGELANCLMHPSCSIEREYAVRIFGDVNDGMIRTLKRGVQLEDGVAQFDSISAVGGENSNSWYHVVLREGRNREVRRLWESQGVIVSRLMRVRYGTVSLPRELHLGRWQELTAPEVAELAALAGLSTPEKLSAPVKPQKQHHDHVPTKNKKESFSSNRGRDDRSSTKERSPAFTSSKESDGKRTPDGKRRLTTSHLRSRMRDADR